MHGAARCLPAGGGCLVKAGQADGAGAQHHLEGGEHDAYDGGEAEEQHLQQGTHMLEVVCSAWILC